MPAELAPRDPEHKLTYLPGMVLNIYPKNNPPRVDKLLHELGAPPRASQINPPAWVFCGAGRHVDLEFRGSAGVDGHEFVSRRYKTREGVPMEEVNTVRYKTRNPP